MLTTHPAETVGDLTPAMADADQPPPVQERLEAADVTAETRDPAPLPEDLPAVAPDADAVTGDRADTAETAGVAAVRCRPPRRNCGSWSVGGAATPLPQPTPMPLPADPPTLCTGPAC